MSKKKMTGSARLSLRRKAQGKFLTAGNWKKQEVEVKQRREICDYFKNCIKASGLEACEARKGIVADVRWERGEILLTKALDHGCSQKNSH